MKKDELKRKIEKYEKQGAMLEAFVLQTAYIESLIRLFADIKLQSITTPELKVLVALKEKIAEFSWYELSSFLFDCGWLPSDKKPLMDRYRIKRNRVLHDLIRQIATKEFESEINEVYKDGTEIISLREFSTTDDFFSLIEKQAPIVSKKPITERENEVMTFRLQGRTYKNIGQTYGISRERVRQILNKALAKVLTLQVPVPKVKTQNVLKVKTYGMKEVESLISNICSSYSISREDLIGKSRKAHLVFPRHMAMYYLRKSMKLSFPRIAEIMGKRDHTTVMHAYGKIDSLIKSEKSNPR